MCSQSRVGTPSVYALQTAISAHFGHRVVVEKAESHDTVRFVVPSARDARRRRALPADSRSSRHAATMACDAMRVCTIEIIGRRPLSSSVLLVPITRTAGACSVSHEEAVQ